jgi:hypothetical protein
VPRSQPARFPHDHSQLRKSIKIGRENSKQLQVASLAPALQVKPHRSRNMHKFHQYVEATADLIDISRANESITKPELKLNLLRINSFESISL